MTQNLCSWLQNTQKMDKESVRNCVIFSLPRWEKGGDNGYPVMSVCVYVSWSTSDLRVRLALWKRFKPSSKIFYWPFQGCSSLWIICVIYVLCLSCIADLWSPAGKGLTSWLLFVMFNWEFVTFPCSILGQMWYLIVLIPNLCRLSYFEFVCFLHNTDVCRIKGKGQLTVHRQGRKPNFLEQQLQK